MEMFCRRNKCITKLEIENTDEQFYSTRNDSDSQIGFEALYQKIKAFFASIQYKEFTFRDLLRPDPKSTLQHLSAVVNFLYYRNERLQELNSLLDEMPSSEDRKVELSSRISEDAQVKEF
ncbi:kinetochore protein Nuf2-like protein [Carex littledalei]|uniref:Kinetochore protein Nuf2-like protein n=1 Tax=Carex littledalei TaxID=544730 RepID=A0A833REH7_9POAL|nr:kinetochore protein Nuf2-like protein [Carex littledalei]